MISGTSQKAIEHGGLKTELQDSEVSKIMVIDTTVSCKKTKNSPFQFNKKLKINNKHFVGLN